MLGRQFADEEGEDSGDISDIVQAINQTTDGGEFLEEEEDFGREHLAADFYQGGGRVEDQVERLFLVKLDAKCAALQQSGQHSEALILMEQGLVSRIQVFGADSSEVLEASRQLVLMYNSLAMSYLYKERYSLCLKLLRKGEELAVQSAYLSSAHVQTLNNLACCYRRMKKPKTSLNLLRETLAILSTGDTDIEARAVTHLNICAILSQLKRHQEALQHAKSAVLYCQKQLLATELKKKISKKHHDHHTWLTEKIVVLGIAYHNLGVEEEFLGHYDDSLEWYYKALALAKAHLGPDEDITNTFRVSFTNAKRAVGNKKQQVKTKRRSVRPTSRSRARTRK